MAQYVYVRAGRAESWPSGRVTPRCTPEGACLEGGLRLHPLAVGGVEGEELGEAPGGDGLDDRVEGGQVEGGDVELVDVVCGCF